MCIPGNPFTIITLDAEVMERSPGLMLSLANLAALRQRIRIEEAALAEIVASVDGVPM